MNANELADELERPNNWQQENNFTTRAATMLRQQHAELDAFKLQYYNTGYSIQLRDKDETIRQQQVEIEELKAKLQLHEAMDNQCASLMQQFRKAQEK